MRRRIKHYSTFLASLSIIINKLTIIIYMQAICIYSFRLRNNHGSCSWYVISSIFEFVDGSIFHHHKMTRFAFKLCAKCTYKLSIIHKCQNIRNAQSFIFSDVEGRKIKWWERFPINYPVWVVRSSFIFAVNEDWVSNKCCDVSWLFSDFDCTNCVKWNVISVQAW